MLPTYCQDVNRFHCSVRTLRALRALTRLQKKTSNMYIYRTFCELGNAGLLRFACISKRKKKKKSNGIRTTVPVQEVNAAAATAATHDDDEHVPSPLFSYFFFFFFSCALSPLDGLCWLDQDLASPDSMFTNEAKPYCRRMCGGP